VRPMGFNHARTVRGWQRGWRLRQRRADEHFACHTVEMRMIVQRSFFIIPNTNMSDQTCSVILLSCSRGSKPRCVRLDRKMISEMESCDQERKSGVFGVAVAKQMVMHGGYEGEAAVNQLWQTYGFETRYGHVYVVLEDYKNDAIDYSLKQFLLDYE
jgi:hypothetical protein